MIILLILLVILIIWLITKRNKIGYDEQIRQISGELRIKYPNFVKAIREVYKDKALLYADNNKVLCYKVPVMTFNRHMGDLFYSLNDNPNSGCSTYIIQGFKGVDRTEINAQKYYLELNKDLEIEEYLVILNDQATEILSDNRYLNSITY